MYIRWQRKPLKHKYYWLPQEYSLRAEIVESKRDPITGIPRTRVIRYLAAIREKYLMAEAHQKYFWERVERCLSVLRLSAGDERNIRNLLLCKVPCSSKS